MTAQDPEKLIIDGQEMEMAFCPLIPKEHPRIVCLYKRIGGRDSGCWRGYHGTWEIKDGYLYLIQIEGGLLLIGEPILADWFSGVLKVWKGELLQYVHRWFESIYEQELRIEIDKGKVIKSYTIDNTVEFK